MAGIVPFLFLAKILKYLDLLMTFWREGMVILVINNMGISFIWNQTFWLVVTDRQAGAGCGVHKRQTGFIWLW